MIEHLERVRGKGVRKIVDTGTYSYNSDLEFRKVSDNIRRIFKIDSSLKSDTEIFNFKDIKDYSFINFISVKQIKDGSRISITFSFSKFLSDDNYTLATNQKTIDSVNSAITKLLRAITLEPLKQQDIEVSILDISNQLPVADIKSFSACLEIIFKALKNFEKNGRLYVDTDEERRKQIDGLDFKEQGKRGREGNSYLKFYSKRKERESRGKSSKHKEAIRGELTLKASYLRKYGIYNPCDIVKPKVENCLREFLCNALIEGLTRELEFIIKTLDSHVVTTKTLKGNLLMLHGFLFDTCMLELVITSEKLGIKERQIRHHKRVIKEALELYEKSSDSKRTYSGNFKRLKQLLHRTVKIDLDFIFEKGGIRVERKENKSFREKEEIC